MSNPLTCLAVDYGGYVVVVTVSQSAPHGRPLPCPAGAGCPGPVGGPPDAVRIRPPLTVAGGVITSACATAGLTGIRAASTIAVEPTGNVLRLIHDPEKDTLK